MLSIDNQYFFYRAALPVDRQYCGKLEYTDQWSVYDKVSWKMRSDCSSTLPFACETDMGEITLQMFRRENVLN